ncbi:hypothetical protein DSM19430T_19080 [Desulfovibrio psychrotolerans]|uniref:Uncharacterized protein n=1 Tax=Desulfovibrio psychrotolerans TaxID=415242 RepID=A0A7J0BW72_9BACT|nr:hypothetical protein DSM19430T_19080 [Desulfovibrio psychrotolerans]
MGQELACPLPDYAVLPCLVPATCARGTLRTPPDWAAAYADSKFCSRGRGIAAARAELKIIRDKF